MSSAQFFLLLFIGFVALAVVSFWMLAYAWKLREAADKSGDKAAASRSRVISNLILASVLAAPLALVFSSLTLDFGYKWHDVTWPWLMALIAIVAGLALGNAYWRSKMLPDPPPLTMRHVAHFFSIQSVRLAGLFLLPLALDHHGVGAWARTAIVFLTLAGVEFAVLQRRKIVWPEPPRQDGAMP